MISLDPTAGTTSADARTQPQATVGTATAPPGLRTVPEAPGPGSIRAWLRGTGRADCAPEPSGPTVDLWLDIP